LSALQVRIVSYPARLKTAGIVESAMSAGQRGSSATEGGCPSGGRKAVMGRCQSVRPVMSMCRLGTQTALMNEPMW
jgi:hypothetical protein